MERLEVFIIFYSLLSCCFSMAVVGTILFFKKMQRGKFLPIILYMSLCDLGLNITSAFGFPDNGTALCWIQGSVATFFTVSGWFWTTMLAHRVYSMVRYGGCTLTFRHMHTICWGLPLFLTIIPFTTSNYGTTSDSKQWCILHRRSGSARWLLDFWFYTTFFIELVGCVGLMIYWQITISRLFKDSAMRDVIRRTYDKVYLYPVAMIICWVLNMICIEFETHNSLLSALSMIFAISNGILSALIFMFKSEEAQRRWYRYLFPPKENRFQDIVEPRLDFELDDDEGPELTDYGDPSFASKPSDFTSDDRVSSVGRPSSGRRGSDLSVSPTSTSNPVHTLELHSDSSNTSRSSL